MGDFVVTVGFMVGLYVALDGLLVGLAEGFLVVGDFVGDFVLVVGDEEGARVSPLSVGFLVGA